MGETRHVLSDLLEADEEGIVAAWIDAQSEQAGCRADRMSRTELAEQSRRFLSSLRQSLASGSTDLEGPAWSATREFLEELSVSRAQQGFSPPIRQPSSFP